MPVGYCTLDTNYTAICITQSMPEWSIIVCTVNVCVK